MYEPNDPKNLYGSDTYTPPNYMERLKKTQDDLAAAQARIRADNAANSPNGYTGQIKNQEAPQMSLMQQMQMYQQQKGAQNEMQSTNPYQQMQNSRYQQMLGQPAVSMPTQPGQGNLGGVGGK